jgi:hypothetical protein
MPKRTFSLANQIAFAELSGDNNPLHVDPVVARRTLFGQPVVHGVHSLMWALDQWLEGRSGIVRLQHLQAVFLKPVGLNQEIRFNLVSEHYQRVRIDLLKDDEVAVRLVFEWSDCEPFQSVDVSSGTPQLQPPDLISKEAIQSCSGFLDLYLNTEIAHQLFPNLTRLLNPIQAAVLLGMTRLVGVKCPGLDSIFSELKLNVSDGTGLQNIKYGVSEFDERYGLVLLTVAAPSLSGTIKAFIRPQPQTQPSFLELKQLVGNKAFASQRALVVGGSRGLGEVAAKLLAAGGAEVQLTYRMGKADAQKIVYEILTGGGRASLYELDILQPQPDWAGLTTPTHLYYFASPYISASGKRNFSPALFSNFCNFYVNGFAGVVESLLKHGMQNVFYPSTVFIDEKPSNFLEYILAKNAGEALCQAFGKKYPGMNLYCPRLPKMATDQTVSLHPIQNPSPAPIILTALQNFSDFIGSK